MIQLRPWLHVLYRYKLPVAIGLFLILFLYLYPQFQYILDDDGVGYATVAKRWAAGDYYRAINGLWSPLHSWISIPFYLAGLDIITAFKSSNALIGIGILAVFNSALQGLAVSKPIKTTVLLASIPFLLYICFFELAADVLFCFLFLLYLLLCSKKAAFTDLRLVAATSFVGALCYYAKAYAFPLFLLHFSVWQFYLYKNANGVKNETLLLRNLTVGILFFLLLCLPWIILLHYKYGIWTISLNVTYGLIPREAINQLVMQAPPWPDSPTPWEDPFIHYPFQRSFIPLSQHLAAMPKEMAHNCLQLIKALNRITYFGAALAVWIAAEAFYRRQSYLLLLLITLCALPLGYLLLHIEERFLWPLFFVLLLGGSHLLHRYLQDFKVSKKVKGLIWICFFAGFVLPPIDYLEDMQGKDKSAAMLANEIKARNLAGKMTSNAHYSLMRQVAFLAGLQYYETNNTDIYDPALPLQVKQHGLEYFLFYSNKREWQHMEQAPLYQQMKRRIHYPELKLVVLENNKQ